MTTMLHNPSPVVIDVLDADWGGARPEDIRTVCLSVIDCFAHVLAESPMVEPLRIEPSPDENPRIVYERQESGHIRVQLCARGTRWSEYAYQFAHELCHALANFCQPYRHSAKWLEEALCETASLFALRSMAGQWAQTPPHPQWREYARILRHHADRTMSVPGRSLKEDANFYIWLSQSLPELQENHELRGYNAIIAAQLLPMFEEDADLWRAVRYLNYGSPVPIAEYFDAWRSATPVEHRLLVDRIEHRLMGE